MIACRAAASIPVIIDYLRAGHAASGKPAFLVTNRQGTGADAQVMAVTTRAGFPVLDGVHSFLRGARCLLDFRDHVARDQLTQQRAAPAPGALLPIARRARPLARAPCKTAPPSTKVTAWRCWANPAAGQSLAPGAQRAEAARSVARELGSPRAQDRDARHHHKSDQDGVRLGLRDVAALPKPTRT